MKFSPMPKAFTIVHGPIQTISESYLLDTWDSHFLKLHNFRAQEHWLEYVHLVAELSHRDLELKLHLFCFLSATE